MLFARKKRNAWNTQPVPEPSLSSPPPPYTLQPSSFYMQVPPPTQPINPTPQFSQPPYLQTQPQCQPASVPYDSSQWAPCATNSGPTQTIDSIAGRNELYDTVADKFSDVITLIDEDCYRGENELDITLPQTDTQLALRGGESTRALSPYCNTKQVKKGTPQEQRVNVFSKLDLYLNSKLPTSLPPLRLYMPTYPLLCLAAKYSASAYKSPQSSAEKKDFVSADGRLGTKAMVLKTVPCDDKKTIVFAIRGTSMLSVRDWGVNLNTEAVSPAGFLDDPGNLCHTGYLKVAKAMVRPIASRLKNMLQENPSRSNCSLLITGHSAGGAVAALLYSHMLSSTVESELNILANCFRRIHCVTFGAPPVSLLPLEKPSTADKRLTKCIFQSFINEGDPVVRAEKPYIRSLVDLLSTPNAPATLSNQATGSLAALGASMSRLDLALKPQKTGSKPSSSKPKLWWPVPSAVLSNAGRLIVLRVPKGKTAEEAVTASIVTDEQLRQVVFGDPTAHQMSLYKRHIEALATRAVTGRLFD